MTASTTTAKRRQGLAAIDPLRQREIASMGGIAAHKSGKAHKFTSEEAKAAGRKGGLKRKSSGFVTP